MSASYHNNALSTFPREIDDLLDFGKARWLEVKFGARMERASPGVVSVAVGRTKRHIRIGAGEFLLKAVHFVVGMVGYKMRCKFESAWCFGDVCLLLTRSY